MEHLRRHRHERHVLRRLGLRPSSPLVLRTRPENVNADVTWTLTSTDCPEEPVLTGGPELLAVATNVVVGRQYTFEIRGLGQDAMQSSFSLWVRGSAQIKSSRRLVKNYRAPDTLVDSRTGARPRRRRERVRRPARSRLAVLHGPRVQGPSRPDARADRDDDDRDDAAPLLRGRPS